MISNEPRMRIATLCATAACATSCGSSDPELLPPAGHLVVYVDTDAPVPSEDPVPDPTAPLPLFDRLLVEIFRPAETEPCQGCSREFDITEQLLRAGGSFVIQHTGSGLRARFRMFRIADVLDEGIPVDASIDVVAALPTIGEEGSISGTVFLPTDSVGRPLGSLDSPIDLAPGAPTAAHVGTWPGAQRVPCAGAARAGEVCVPGGAFWMGGVDAGRNPLLRRRLVVLSPYFLDAGEATVSAFRASGLATPLTVVPWSGSTAGTVNVDYCTFTHEPDPARDALPVTCVSWAGAKAFCEGRGAELPTEAELEFVAGGLRSTPYPWGRDEPTCDDAIWGRGVGAIWTAPTPCAEKLGLGTLEGPLTLGDPGATAQPPRKRDFLLLESGALFDLAGNASEWSLDHYQVDDEPCWSPANIYADPVCATEGSAGPSHTMRGGSFVSVGMELRRGERTAGETGKAYPVTGFRCARKAAAEP